MLVHRRSVRRTMIAGLRALAERGPMKTIRLPITTGARSDFTILKYFGLIYKWSGENKEEWAITLKGRGFLYEGEKIAKYVYVFNGMVEGRSEEEVSIEEVCEEKIDKEIVLLAATPKSMWNRDGCAEIPELDEQETLL